VNIHRKGVFHLELVQGQPAKQQLAGSPGGPCLVEITKKGTQAFVVGLCYSESTFSLKNFF
jgi:hypothetical protein